MTPPTNWRNNKKKEKIKHHNLTDIYDKPFFGLISVERKKKKDIYSNYKIHLFYYPVKRGCAGLITSSATGWQLVSSRRVKWHSRSQFYINA